WKRVLDRLRQQSYLTRGIRMKLQDERKGKPTSGQSYGFYFEGGISSYVKYLNHGIMPVHDTIFYAEKVVNEIQIETALQYADDLQARELGFANNIYTPEGGMHITGFRTALTRVLNDFARKSGFLKQDEENLIGDDVREGLTVIVSVRLKETQFEGQTRTKLGNPEARTAVESFFSEAFSAYLEEHPADARAIAGKVILAAKARKAAKAAKDTILRKGILDGMTLPGKLADCQSRKAEESELFLVEGDSAGGCFSGDTKIALTDGRNMSFKELVKEYQEGKKNYCYTIAEDGSIVIGDIANPCMTKRGSEVIKVSLENGEEIICTPDHKFMLRDGVFKEAQYLTPDDSLMPLYRKYSKIGGQITIDGYEMVFDPHKHRWIFTHLLSDAYNLERSMYKKVDGSHRHHKDFNKLNNNPNNLVRISREEHLAEHRRLVQRTLHRPDVLEKVRELHKTPEFRQQRKTAYNQTYYTHSIKALYDIFQTAGVVDVAEYEAKRKETGNKNVLKYETVLTRFFAGNEPNLVNAVSHYNHRVKRVVKLETTIDVYDIEVPGTHNFALASGVFVHNSAKGARDRRTQAILPLRGKILNVERARIDKMLASKEIKALVIALGAAIADEFNLDKIRYHKIVIMTDADVDGAHIRTLLLTLFYRYYRPVIEAGYLYIAQPPLYKISRGREFKYAYSEGQKELVIKEIHEKLSATGGKGKEEDEPSVAEAMEGVEGLSPEVFGKEGSGVGEQYKGFNLQRYKGLGEMNPDQLRETTMDPANRLMMQVNVRDGAEADHIFDILMGDEVAPRKSFIQTHAKAVKNLDI
ncbi:MAG: toprim domain-containing protein, partial [Patescibacteria group bacterium]